MSSVVTARGDAAPQPRSTTLPPDAERRAPRRELAAGVVGTVILCLVAFLASGGVDLPPNTWVQVGLIVIASATAVALVLRGSGGRLWGGVTLLLFAALAALTYASIAWSVQPANSWMEANRTLSYLAVFATALMLARLAPERWRGLVGAVAAATTLVCGYSLLVKIFPGSLAPNDPLGRLSAPFDYWNAVGLMGALGLGPCLWAGARRDGSLVMRALSVPAIAILIPALLLAYSRGSIAAALIGLAVWFTLAPLRLRSAAILAPGSVGAAAIAAWGLSTRAISADGVSLAARTSAGHSFGVVIVVVLCLSAAAGLAVVRALDASTLPAATRRTVGKALIGLVALIPVVGIAALAASSRGLTGEVSHVWKSLTNPNGVVSDRPGRLVDLSNSRPHYWSQAITLGEHHLPAGVGALGFATAQPSSSSPVWNSQHAHAVHAHGYLAETFADFGLIGLLLSLALLVAWWVAAAHTLEWPWPRSGRAERAPPSDRDGARATPGEADGATPGEADGDSAPAGKADDATPSDHDSRTSSEPALAPERAGLVAMLAVVVTFGFHSLIDWTWFIPGTTVPALACAGWLAGRGPLTAPIRGLERTRSLTRTPAVAAALVLTLVLMLVAGWVILQPLRSSDAYSAAVTAAVQGDGANALSAAQTASVENPVSVDPLFLLSRLYDAMGERGAARHELVQATARQPANPATWQELGCYDFAHHQPSAGGEFRRLLDLQPADTQAEADPAAFCASAL